MAAARPLETTSSALLVAVRAGDHDAFTAWVMATRPAVYRVCRSYCRTADDTDDLVATVYLHAWRARATLRPDLSGVSWLCRVARNVAISDLRRRGRHPEECLTDACLAHLVTEDEAPTHPERAERARAVERVLAQLPPHQAALLLLRDRDGHPIATIAARTGLRPGAVRSALFRARRAFRVEWERAHTHPTSVA